MIQTKKREASLIRSNWKWLYSAQKFNRDNIHISISFQSAMVRSFLLISLTIVLQGKVYKSFEIIFCMNKALNMHIQNISFTIHLQLQQKIVYIYFQCYMYIDKYVEIFYWVLTNFFPIFFFFGLLSVFFCFVLSHYWLIFSIYFIFALDDICRKKNYRMVLAQSEQKIWI